MKRIIQLPDIDSVKEFVQTASEMDQDVIVTKEGFGVYVDGASLLGMISLIGAKIMVESSKNSERLLRVIDRYQVLQ